jgi:hypothetical protein
MHVHGRVRFPNCSWRVNESLKGTRLHIVLAYDFQMRVLDNTLAGVFCHLKLVDTARALGRVSCIKWCRKSMIPTFPYVQISVQFKQQVRCWEGGASLSLGTASSHHV